MIDDTVRKKSRRGFAGMDRDKQREIAAKGGAAAQASGKAHRWSPLEARQASRRRSENIRSRTRRQDEDESEE